MIKVKDLSFSYRKNEQFIKDISFNIEKGKITTILGPNGSGKSTLLSVLCGLNKPLAGEVVVNGREIKEFKNKELAKVIASVHQHNSVPADITVKELIEYGRLPHKGYFQGINDEDREIVDWAIKRVGLEKLKDKAVMEMSGGERQRVFLAMALAQKSQLLFLDEPTTYLDIYHQIELLELIKELKLKENLTIVMVLHDINQALSYSDNIMVMKNGMLISSGKAEEVISMKLLNDVYNIDGFLNTHNDNVYFVPMKKQEKNCF